MTLILASNSPRRKDILKQAGYDFKIIPSNYDEHISRLNFSRMLVENCAKNKALNITDKAQKEDIIISADTVVVLDNIILGKPKDKKEAFDMLKSLSNKTHFVATAICLIKDNKIITDTEITYVTFRNLSDDEIKNYIEKQTPLDKAGSYGIQDDNFDFVVSIDGEMDNVIGFPLKLFEKSKEKFSRAL